ncbi:MAG: hypothetical protein AABY46_07315, partial [Nitrospirota bacterium]
DVAIADGGTGASTATGTGIPVFDQSPTIYTPTINSTNLGGNTTFPNGFDFRPSANSTTAINIAQADGTDFVNFDTTNRRVGIGGIAAPAQRLDVNYGNLRFNTITAPIAASGVSQGSGGSLGDSDGVNAYKWKVTYVSAEGETEAGTVSAAVNTVASDSVLLTIPVSSNSFVTSRKIYRNKIAVPTAYYLVTTVANNTATTYLDTTADGSLGASDVTYKDNTTAGQLYIDGSLFGWVGNYSAAFGKGALPIGTGISNTAFGANAMVSGLNASYNTAFGSAAYRYSTGTNNAAFGFSAMNNTTGSYNSGFGTSVFNVLSTGSYNSAFGRQALVSLTTGIGNIGVGASSGEGTDPTNNKATIDDYSGY